MTQQSTIARAAKLDRPGIAWIGSYRVGGEPVEFVVGEDDLARDAAWAAQILGEYGIGKGDHMLVTGTPSDTPWLEQFRLGARRIGVVTSNSDAWSWDARRSEMYIRRLDTKLILGLSIQTIEGIGQIVDAAQRLGQVAHLIARPDAIAALASLGLEAGVVVRLGPAVAISAPNGSGLCVNEAEWAVGVDDGELVVSSVGSRLAMADGVATGLRGAVASTAAGARITLE